MKFMLVAGVIWVVLFSIVVSQDPNSPFAAAGAAAVFSLIFALIVTPTSWMVKSEEQADDSQPPKEEIGNPDQGARSEKISKVMALVNERSSVEVRRIMESDGVSSESASSILADRVEKRKLELSQLGYPDQPAKERALFETLGIDKDLSIEEWPKLAELLIDIGQGPEGSSWEDWSLMAVQSAQQALVETDKYCRKFKTYSSVMDREPTLFSLSVLSYYAAVYIQSFIIQNSGLNKDQLDSMHGALMKAILSIQVPGGGYAWNEKATPYFRKLITKYAMEFEKAGRHDVDDDLIHIPPGGVLANDLFDGYKVSDDQFIAEKMEMSHYFTEIALSLLGNAVKEIKVKAV